MKSSLGPKQASKGLLANLRLRLGRNLRLGVGLRGLRLLGVFEGAAVELARESAYNPNRRCGFIPSPSLCRTDTTPNVVRKNGPARKRASRKRASACKTSHSNTSHVESAHRHTHTHSHANDLSISVLAHATANRGHKEPREQEPRTPRPLTQGPGVQGPKRPRNP